MIFIDRIRKGQVYQCPEANPKPLRALEDAQKLLFSSPAGQWECEFAVEGEKIKVALKDVPDTATSLRFYAKDETPAVPEPSTDQALGQLRLMLQQTLFPVIAGFHSRNMLLTDAQPLIDECIDDLVLRLDANIINR